MNLVTSRKSHKGLVIVGCCGKLDLYEQKKHKWTGCIGIGLLQMLPKILTGIFSGFIFFFFSIGGRTIPAANI